MLEADVTDTFGIPLQNSSRYDDVVEVSEKLYDVDSYIMIHAAGGIAKDWWNIIRIYDSYSWIFILTVFFIECFCALVIYRTEKVVGFTTRKKDLDLEAGNRRLVSEGSQRWLEDRMADSVEFPFLQLKSALKKHPLIEGLYPDEVIDKVLYENAVMYGQADFRGYFDALAHCDILHSNIVFPLIGTHLLFPKNFSLMPQINKIILDNQFKFKNINIRYSKLVSPTSCEKFRPGDPLRINFYIGPLIVCSIVFFVAFVTLIIEFCFKWFCDFRKQDLHKLYNVTVWVNK
ncbi:unnamed protein product [Bursaphelenchus okinawaensis]|uniref:Uncharacterized protein n=1 Tax=Bursaphelenchus okinawaensis TaxID=465554 RepID=A0A811K621_9BILA|nr:unnamed protein product [Bursaphelenchus okinawaensis]CAG9092139.1 unnamed protein product [Bursaphelenchus okinawaensis]